MPNTLTNLIPDMYAALAVVSREQVGFIPAVTLDADVARAAVGQVVRSPIAPAGVATDVIPGVTPPDDGDANITNRTITITKSRRVPVRFNGEESRGLNNGPGMLTVRAQRFAQAMRTLTNEMEADIAALYRTTSRAFGIAGTNPFNTAGDYSDVSFVRQILVDNGAPISDLQLVINTTAGAVFRGKQSQAQMIGDVALQRQGLLLDIHGMQIRESAQVRNHVRGTGASYLVNNGPGYASGAATIAADTGAGTILAGDVVAFAGNADRYVVANALSGGSFGIGEPGLRATLADNVAITVGNNYAANMAFSRSAIVAATRAPALPDGTDMADDRYMLTDPNSGLTFEVSTYMQYRQVQYEVALSWGVANMNPAHTAILLG
ncbi:MAG: P22 coat - protein 5 family protein [Proteobacteria bacterium ST_bin11]|nr:MAG: P22 coat - protein 5 family protein [Proteobacteria bacterium ST_bin11]